MSRTKTAKTKVRLPATARWAIATGVLWLAACAGTAGRPTHAAQARLEALTSAIASTDLIGGDYQALRTRDLTSCRAACAGDARCRAYAYWVGGDGPGGKTCFLKARVPVAVEREGVISGRRLFARDKGARGSGAGADG